MKNSFTKVLNKHEELKQNNKSKIGIEVVIRKTWK